MAYYQELLSTFMMNFQTKNQLNKVNLKLKYLRLIFIVIRLEIYLLHNKKVKQLIIKKKKFRSQRMLFLVKKVGNRAEKFWIKL